jgi:hypothetical protein
MKPRVRRRFEPVSDFELEAYLCDELDAIRRAHIERCIASDHELGAYVETRQRSRASFADLHPLQVDALVLRRRERRSVRALFPLLGAAAAVFLGLTVWWPQERTNPQRLNSSTDTVRVKGQVELRAHLAVKRGQHVWAHRPELRLRAGDQLRLAVDTDAPGYVTLLGRDAHGNVTIYYDALQTSGGRFLAADSLTLDAQAGDELWHVVLSPQRQAAAVYTEKLARSELSDVAHAFFRIQKDPP